ncbi:MAG: hypothetical protein ACK5RG_08035 [Cyclobacteriaceae bacterium]|jgi:hypothetical protein|nr:hypothetical protein [Flammeovirgaceae bacterium]
MTVHELSVNSELTRDLEQEVGKEFTFRERLRYGAYGIGHLRLRVSYPNLPPLPSHNQYKIHFDWTPKGAVVRIRAGQKLFGIGIRLEEITRISVIKKPNFVSMVPFFPMWILSKLGVPFEIARWFKSWGDKIEYGSIRIEIELENQSPLIFELKGDLWRSCVTTFKWHKVRDRLFIERIGKINKRSA